jgi:hypothetical protein
MDPYFPYLTALLTKSRTDSLVYLKWVLLLCLVCRFVLVWALERNKPNEMWVYVYKELAHEFVETGKSKICSVGQQGGNLKANGTVPAVRPVA